MNLKQKKHLVSEIRGMNQGLKEIYESELHRKQESVQQSKAGQIKNEIKKISMKDTEARQLEQKEEQLLKRLKETHAL